MAGVERNWAKALIAVALISSAGVRARAPYRPSGSLAGKLTDMNSTPLEGAAVELRNESTGAVARTTTGKNGVYLFQGIEPGEYVLEADSPELGHGWVDGWDPDFGGARVEGAGGDGLQAAAGRAGGDGTQPGCYAGG